MAFFLVMKGHLKEYSFSYLSENPGPRIAKTLVPGAKESTKDKKTENKPLYVIDLMSKEFHALSPAKNLNDAKELMDSKGINHLPLLIDNILCGLVSQYDLKTLLDRNDHKTRLSEVMTKTVLCVSENESIENIAKVFIKEAIHCLPVVDTSMALVGMITPNDILQWVLDKKLYYKDL